MIEYLKKFVGDYIRFLKLKEFDSSTVQGARHERYRRTLLASISTLLSRGLSAISNLLIVYISVPLLGAEQYSVWVIVATLCQIITIFDAGIPSSMINTHAQIFEIDDKRKTTYFSIIIILIVSLIALAIGIVSFVFLPWGRIINSETAISPDDLKTILIYSSPTILIQIMNIGCTNILIGMQKTHLSNILNIITTLTSLALISLLGSYNPTPLTFIWATQISSIFIPIIIILYLFKKGHLIFPKPKIDFRLRLQKQIKLSRSFFIVNSVGLLSSSSDTLLATTFLDPHDISLLNTLQRLFLTLANLILILVAPTWTAYAEAYIQNDVIFIRNTLRRSLTLTLLIFLTFGIPTVLLSKYIFLIWTNGTLSPDWLATCLVATMAFLNAIIGTISVYMNGCGIMRPQIRMNLSGFAISIILKIVMVSAFGLNGLIAAGVISTVLVYGFGYGVLYKKYIFGWLKSHP